MQCSNRTAAGTGTDCPLHQKNWRSIASASWKTNDKIKYTSHSTDCMTFRRSAEHRQNKAVISDFEDRTDVDSHRIRKACNALQSTDLNRQRAWPGIVILIIIIIINVANGQTTHGRVSFASGTATQMTSEKVNCGLTSDCRTLWRNGG